MNTGRSLKAGLCFITMAIVDYFLIPNISNMAESSGVTGALAVIISIMLWLAVIAMTIILPVLVYSMDNIKVGNGIVAGFWLIIMALMSPFIMAIIDAFIGMMINDKNWILVAIIAQWMVLIVIMILPAYMLLIRNDSII